MADDDPYPGVTVDDNDSGGFRVHSPLTIVVDVWPSHEDLEDHETPIINWVAEYSLNCGDTGYSLGFVEFAERPNGDDLRDPLNDITIALRDTIRAVAQNG